MEVVEIYGDAAGETHLRPTTIEFEIRNFAPPSQPVRVSAEIPSLSSVFVVAPPGWDREFHPTPRKQLAVLLDGRIRISVTDGDTIEIKAGGTFLLNDMASKGHLTEVQGEQDASFLLVVLEESAI
jgi:hypothetical protein